MELIITKDNFATKVLKADKPVLVDFWATWCGPCQMLSPVIAEIAEEKQAEIYVGKVNVDEEPELAEQFGVYSIPTLIVFQNGEIRKTSVGYQSKDSVLELLGENK